VILRKGENNGEGGIRTRGTGLYPYDGLANRCLKPLGHLSEQSRNNLQSLSMYCNNNISCDGPFYKKRWTIRLATHTKRRPRRTVQNRCEGTIRIINQSRYFKISFFLVSVKYAGWMNGRHILRGPNVMLRSTLSNQHRTSCPGRKGKSSECQRRQVSARKSLRQRGSLPGT
jgi:hypothetical protein